VGEHGERYLPAKRWVEQAANALHLARISDSFVRLHPTVQLSVIDAIMALQKAYDGRKIRENTT
jgi:hypothetical protein